MQKLVLLPRLGNGNQQIGSNYDEAMTLDRDDRHRIGNRFTGDKLISEDNSGCPLKFNVLCQNPAILDAIRKSR